MTSMIMIILKIIIISFSRTHALLSGLISCDFTIHKYKSITEERPATDVSSHMFTAIGFSSEQVFLIRQSRYLLPPFGYRPKIECLRSNMEMNT